MILCLRALLVSACLLVCAQAEALESSASPTPPTTAKSPAPFVIAVFGDSQAEGLAAGMRQVLAADKSYRVLNRSKPGTALSQPLDYDWPAAVAKFAGAESADVAIMWFGGNDTLPTRVADGQPIAYRSDDWIAGYEDREKKIVGSLTDAGIHVVWCGAPIASSPRYSEAMDWLNARFQEALPSSNTEYLSLWTVVADPDGHYIGQGTALDGATRQLRGVDGIHFTGEGYKVVAARVLAAITHWREQQQAASQVAPATTPAENPSVTESP